MLKRRTLSKYQVNKLIDDLIHPFMREYPALIVIDGILHAINEGNPEESLRKFIKYDLSKLIDEVVKWLLNHG